MENIFLIGFMGCGKSTVSAYLSKQYHMEILEMDQMIVEQEGMPIAQIFEQFGEPYFRDLETKLLKAIEPENNQVISCGGGVALRMENVEAMKKTGKIVLLYAKPETILERVKNDHRRPLLEGNHNIAFINKIMEQRRPYYEQAADFIITTDGKEVDEICAEIMEKVQK